MTTTSRISCRVTATGPGLTLIARVDNREFFRGDACDGQEIALDLEDDDAEHVLTFELLDKTFDHTKLDDSGAILQDTTVSVQDLAFDDIKLGQLLYEKAVYRHDFNGTADLVEEKFYGTMGCNGTVRLEFTTPIYLWLLEHM